MASWDALLSEPVAEEGNCVGAVSHEQALCLSAMEFLARRVAENRWDLPLAVLVCNEFCDIRTGDKRNLSRRVPKCNSHNRICNGGEVIVQQRKNIQQSIFRKLTLKPGLGRSSGIVRSTRFRCTYVTRQLLCKPPVNDWPISNVPL